MSCIRADTRVRVRALMRMRCRHPWFEVCTDSGRSDAAAAVPVILLPWRGAAVRLRSVNAFVVHVAAICHAHTYSCLSITHTSRSRFQQSSEWLPVEAAIEVDTALQPIIDRCMREHGHGSVNMGGRSPSL